jgi:hypothetical protein
MLEACNRHFLIVQALVNKIVCVTTSDFCYSQKFENFKILPILTMIGKNVQSHVFLYEK